MIELYLLECLSMLVLNTFKTYLKKTYDLLKDNGVFLLHTIGQRGVPTATSPWIRKYIFPGGYIPSYLILLMRLKNLI